MTSQPSGSGGPLYRGNPAGLSPQYLQVNGRQRPSASSSSGAVSQTSRSTPNTRDIPAGGVSPGKLTPRTGQRPAPQRGPRAPRSELTRSFDPNKNMHLWTMWRTAVNGRIVDEVKQHSHSMAAAAETRDAAATAAGRALSPLSSTANAEQYHYGQALVKPPLDRFVRVENGSQTLASLMVDPHGEGGSALKTDQFVFYGVPRVVLNRSRHSASASSQQHRRH